MKSVLVTGANGFIGKNLIEHLRVREDVKIYCYGRDNNFNDLESYIEEVDFIFHLAGVNRPKEVSEYEKINYGLTETLVELHGRKNKKKAPILFTSSIQAELDNPYGKSKRLSEEVLFEYSKKHNIPVYIYRLPNVFGKWCKPNYNSVVATFCYNIAHDIPIQIHDPNRILTLVYIDDVIEEFLNAFDGKANQMEDGFCYVKRTFNISLSELAEIIKSFKSIEKTLIVPNFGNELIRFLYATYMSYVPREKLEHKLEKKEDERGWLSEVIKSNNFGQIFISKTKPGVARGNHWHHTKVEKFLVIEGEALIKLRQINGNEVIEFKVTGDEPKIIDIPVGYTHSITNIGDRELITLFWANEIFDPANPDTYYLEV
ncbi:NAD-dependent epimerase/dehydratase [Caldicellulosiruptor acetigenus I77R1B]|uniref:NAD-dependent epimerase/dehydratase n=2 Tax=Caldicellulosiruptor acetigenus TaxID=301953 RepID=G2PWB4_9FIRM|nr:NAD-dependent epimerase/dehydratase family protein [Caldicellulosiruptor acetigenus]ADQ41734.1 NAD-dependent epimerase/dehydratase [Caldicellulosiruptor acetigenus I77R1B]AEM72858.1 NAD-dependent epimerase/dehydratase [Caldicellulosiruptor acetigenus 6A]